MKKQIWVICNQEEQNELLSHLKDYKVGIDNEKQEFPIIIDKELKVVYRCTSITSCGLYTKFNGKIKHYTEIKHEILKEI